MKFCRMFIYDLRNSLKYNLVIYLLTACMMAFACMDYGSAVRWHNETEQLGEAGYQEYLLNIVRGMEKLTEDSASSRQINIPVVYIGMAIFISYITGRYIFNDSVYTVLVKGRSRTAWIISKSIVMGVQIALVYITALAVSLLFGGTGKAVEISRCISLMKMENVLPAALEQPLFLVLTLAVPMSAAYAIAQLQITVSLIFNNIAGFVTAMIIYLGSVFEYNLIMLGNGCMVQRSRYFTDNGFGIKMILLFDVVVILAAMVVQVFTVQKKDFFRA